MKQKTFHLTENRKQQAIEELSAILQERNEVAFAYLFGSFIEDRPVHDVDVGVYLSAAEKIPALPYALELSDLLSTSLHMPVEVTILNNAPPAFLYHVINGRLILDRDDELRSRVAEDAVRRYLDHKPLALRAIKEAFAA